MSTALTPAQKQAASKRTEIGTWLQHPNSMKRFEAVLEGTLLTPERIVNVALTALTRTPALLNCTPMSVAFAVQLSAEAGLPVDGYHAHLIPYGTTCQFIPDYKGLIQLALRNDVLIEADVVHAKDSFRYRRGLQPLLEHELCSDDDPGPLTFAYAIASFGSRKIFEVMNRRQIEKRKASSKSAAGKDSPWRNWEEEMWKKTVIKQLMKFVPRSAQMNAADANDSLQEAGLAHLHPQAAEYGIAPPSRMTALEDALGAHAAEAELAPPAAPAAPELTVTYNHEAFEKLAQACETEVEVESLFNHIRERKEEINVEDYEDAYDICKSRTQAIRKRSPRH